MALEKYLTSALENEKKRYEQIVAQQQAQAYNATLLNSQLRESSACSERLTYDMQALQTENTDARAMEDQCNNLLSKNHLVSEKQEGFLNLQSTVQELKACQRARRGRKSLRTQKSSKLQ